MNEKSLTSSDLRFAFPMPSSKINNLEEQRIINNSSKIGEYLLSTQVIVPDIRCVVCISKIETKLAEFAGVKSVRVNLTLKTANIVWSKENCNILEVLNGLKSLGFDYHLHHANDVSRNDTRGQKLLRAVAISGFAAANIMLLSVSVWSGTLAETTDLFHLISGLIAVPTVAIAGQPFFVSAFTALKSRQLNMDVPISLAVLLALFMSIYETLNGGKEAYFDACVTLLFFLLVGRYLDHLMREKARNGVENLSSITAKDGTMIDENGDLTLIPLNAIQPGMKLRVFPGDRFPVNVEILTGDTEVDRSHVNGESEPKFICSGNFVEAGALNLSAPVDVLAKSNAQTSFLADMTRMVEAAEQNRGKYVQIADRMAKIYAPAVHLLALIAFILWMFLTDGDWHLSLYTAIAVLIVTCPCALGLAVPIAHVVSASNLMKKGILLRNGGALERLSDIDYVVFDKTGTLTSDVFTVKFQGDIGDKTLSIIKSLSSHSLHPYARSLSDFLVAHKNIELEGIKEHPGLGLQAIYGGKIVRLGKPSWVYEITDESPKHQKQPSVVFAMENQNPHHFDINLQIREGAAPAIKQLKTLAYELEILSGDGEEKVSKFANELGITFYKSEQTPQEKAQRIDTLKNLDRKVLMVGDGINDAPVLAAAHASMAPASASDIGRSNADLIFTDPSLKSVPDALIIAQKTKKIVLQNFALAICYNCIAVPLAMLGFITPLIAAIAMSLSSVVVVLNSLRLNIAPSNPATATQTRLTLTQATKGVLSS